MTLFQQGIIIMTVINENKEHKTMPIDLLFPPDLITRTDQFLIYFETYYFQTSEESMADFKVCIGV